MQTEARFSVADARALEAAKPDIRMELIDGVLYAMGRASPWHAALTMAIGGEVRRQLKSPCRALSESLAIGVNPRDATYLHPDVTVVCGPPQIHPEEPTILLNPRAIFEVLSPGTALRDRNEKLDRYQAISTIEVIVHFDHDVRRVVMWTRTETGWHQTVHSPGRLDIPVLEVQLDTQALYEEAAAFGGPPKSPVE